MKAWLLLASLFYSCLYTSFAVGQSPYQYQALVRKSAAQVHSGYPKTFFCRFHYDARLEINMPGASFLSKPKRQVKWMPIVSLSRIGEPLACYHSRCQYQKKLLKGPLCCTLRNERYRKIEGDLHNWVPVVPMLAQWRGERAFGQVSKSAAQHGECGLKRDEHVVEPPDIVKGTVARAYLYMNDIYHIGLTRAELSLFHQWHEKFPPDLWEKTWDLQVAAKQGRHNPYIFRGKDIRRGA